ncbi:MAG TPA: Xaa-Pro peptidase family protein [Chloroflexota bacterium]|jgi:Xaa-Pro aminopeptidase|nr:Xaa-Pro peptidase family protein [Chloroflexota bacterium]
MKRAPNEHVKYVGISTPEFAARRHRLLAGASSSGASGTVLFGADCIRYFTGFNFLATERPVVFALSSGGDMALLVPGFEVEHARLKSSVERIHSYPEYPGERHPMLFLADILADMGIGREIAADGDGYPGILGYRGPSLSAVTGATIMPIGDVIEKMMAIKSQAEIDLIKESARWCAVGHELLQKYSVAGATEGQASLRAEYEATLAMIEALGGQLNGRQGSSDGVKAGYRGQIGKYSALAHAVAGNHVFKPGDVLVSETGAPVWGYTAELERTMIIGHATSEQARLFEHMTQAQQVAVDAVKPGRTCADVDRDVLEYFERNDLMRYWGQHTGHAIGLRNHEAPFLDVGDTTVIRTGMVFTIEPGIYVPGVAGFRHSDTVVVTEDGAEVITDYPRDIESLTIQA